MSPYRKPAPMPAHEPEPSRPDPDRWLSRFLWTLLVLAVVVIGRGAYVRWRDGPPPPAPCSSFADWPAKDIPARCTKTYDETKP